jgi:four helix bundle protein
LRPRQASFGIDHATPSGMGVYRFEDLRVWQAARKQCERVGDLLKRREFAADRELCEQLNGASISVMNNISEGFLRRRDAEFAQFLRFSAGSNGEVRTCYHIARDRRYLNQQEAEDLLELSNSIGRMTTRLQQTLAPGRSRTKDHGPSTTKDQGRTKDGPRTKHQGPRTDRS